MSTLGIGDFFLFPCMVQYGTFNFFAILQINFNILKHPTFMLEVPAGIASWEHINMCGRDSHLKMSLSGNSEVHRMTLTRQKWATSCCDSKSPRPNILHILLYNFAHF